MTGDLKLEAVQPETELERQSSRQCYLDLFDLFLQFCLQNTPNNPKNQAAISDREEA